MKVNLRFLLLVSLWLVFICFPMMLLDHIVAQDKELFYKNGTYEQEIPSPVMEAEFYYATEVDQRYDQIRQFDFSDSEEKALLLEELKELDAVHQQVMEDLQANPGDERVINALVRHYQLKLEVMDQIIYQLNLLKTESDKKDENESV